MKSDFFKDHDKLENDLYHAGITAYRMPEHIARVDYQEMVNYRSMTEAEAYESYLAEEALKLN
jgi:hypothetical protein